MRLQLAIFALLMIACSHAAIAQADEGRWSGSIEGRGNYFWERSTRVVVPEVKATVVSPNGVRVGAGYLLDAITSASIASGVSEDEAGTEYRHGIGLEVGKEFDLGSTQLDVALNGVYSTENDYKSLVYGLSTSLLLDEKNTKLTLSATHVQDDIESNADPMFAGELSGMSLGAGFEQLIGPSLVFSLSYQFGYLQGFLGNPYRYAKFADGAPRRESHPDTRYRHSVTSRLAWHLPSDAIDTSIHLLYTVYADSWDIAALSPELRVYQMVTRDFLLRPRYRFYIQSKAWFQTEGVYPAGWDDAFTGDPKMAELTTHTLGLAVEYRLSFLADTFLDFASAASLDIGFDRYWSTSTFGNGVMATAGGRLEF